MGMDTLDKSLLQEGVHHHTAGHSEVSVALLRLSWMNPPSVPLSAMSGSSKNPDLPTQRGTFHWQNSELSNPLLFTNGARHYNSNRKQTERVASQYLVPNLSSLPYFLWKWENRVDSEILETLYKQFKVRIQRKISWPRGRLKDSTWVQPTAVSGAGSQVLVHSLQLTAALKCTPVARDLRWYWDEQCRKPM